MKDNILKDLSSKNMNEVMKHYTTVAQKAVQMLQFKDPRYGEKALENLQEIKNQLIETVYALAGKIGLPKEQIEKMNNKLII